MSSLSSSKRRRSKPGLGLVSVSLALIFWLTACTEQPAMDVTSETSLGMAVQNGLIAPVDSLAVKESDYALAEAVVGDLTRYGEIRVQVTGPVRRDLYFERDLGRLETMNASQYQMVSKGEVLATLAFDPEALEAERAQLLINRNLLEQQYSNEDAARQNALEQARNDFHSGMTDKDGELAALRVAKLELEYERFVYNHNRTRRDYDKQLKEIDEKLKGEALLAPFDGVVISAYSGKTGSLIRNWTRMITLIDYSVIQFTLQAPIETVRYGDVMTLTDNKDLTFNARVVSDPLLTDTRQGTYTYILMPEDGEAFARRIIEMELDLRSILSFNLVAVPLMFEETDALIIPRAAVQPEDTKQFVYIYEDGMLKKRYVQTGLLYQDEIQVLAGLEPGQMVVLN